jgi:hypothetical protein
MNRDRKSSILLLIAAAAFLVGALLSESRQPLRFVAAGAMLLAAILQFRKSRRLRR